MMTMRWRGLAKTRKIVRTWRRVDLHRSNSVFRLSRVYVEAIICISSPFELQTSDKQKVPGTATWRHAASGIKAQAKSASRVGPPGASHSPLVHFTVIAFKVSRVVLQAALASFAVRAALLR